MDHPDKYTAQECGLATLLDQGEDASFQPGGDVTAACTPHDLYIWQPADNTDIESNIIIIGYIVLEFAPLLNMC